MTDQAAARAIIEDWRTAPMPATDRALCWFAEKLATEPARMSSCDVQALRDAGFSDVAIHDAVQVVSYFSYINRVADGLGTDLEEGMPPRPRSWFPEPVPVEPRRRDARISFQPVTTDNLSRILRLRVAPFQERFVASNAVSLAQASFYPALWCAAIAADDEPVGFVMLENQADKGACFVVRFLIDERFQRLGFGGRAMQLVIDHARTMPGTTRVTLTYVPAPGSPEPFYRRLGFSLTGRIDEDGEVEMELRL